MDSSKLIIILLLVVSDTISGCNQVPKSVKVLFLVNTPSFSVDQLNQSEQIVRDVVTGLSEHSKVYVNEIGYTLSEIISFNKSNGDLSWMDKIQFGKDTRLNRDNSIHSSIIDRELKSRFSVSLYKREAEFVVLLVSDKTELDDVSLLLKKKKTFVIVLGSSVPKIFKTIASRDDYLVQVKSIEDTEVVASKIKEQITCDSNQFCDTDSYSLGEYSRCRSCIPPCSQNTSICSQRCRFMQPNSVPVDNVDGKSENIGKTTESSGVVKVLVGDNKYFGIGSIIGALGAIIFAIVALVIIYCICKKGDNKPITPVSSEETIPKICEPNDSYPVQVEPEAERLIEDQPAAVGAGQNSCADGERISMEFKNNLELDQNRYANKDHYIDMSKGREIDCE